MRATFTVASVIATAWVGCGTHTVSSAGRCSAAEGGGVLSQTAQPWPADVSGAAKSDRSDAILQTLSDLGGWGNGNVLQTDFAIAICGADSSTPVMDVVGIDDYCGGGPDCDTVPARMPVPADA